jgi:hypothetical protein
MASNADLYLVEQFINLVLRPDHANTCRALDTCPPSLSEVPAAGSKYYLTRCAPHFGRQPRTAV